MTGCIAKISAPSIFLARNCSAPRSASSTVPVGTYQTEVYLIRDNRIVAAQSTPLFIDKQGIEQEVYDFSRAEPAVYGLVAVLLAVFAGWLAAVVFRRG